MNESMQRQRMSLDCGNWLPHTKCIGIAQVKCSCDFSLSWLWTESAQFPLRDVEPGKTS